MQIKCLTSSEKLYFSFCFVLFLGIFIDTSQFF